MQYAPRREQFKGMERKVPRNAEQNDHGAQRPNPHRWQEQPWQMLAAKFEECVRRRSVSQERQQQDRQRIQRPRSPEVPLQ